MAFDIDRVCVSCVGCVSLIQNDSEKLFNTCIQSRGWFLFVCLCKLTSQRKIILYVYSLLTEATACTQYDKLRTNLVCNGTKKVYKNRNGNPVRPPHTPNSTVPMPRLTPGGEGQRRRRRRRSHTATSCCQSQYHKHRPPAGKPNREVRRPARTTTTTTTNSGRQRMAGVVAGVDDVVVVGGRGSKLN